MCSQPSKSVRQGLSLDYLIDKRASVLAALRSSEHQEQTPTQAYGTHDPTDVPLWSCEVCHVPPQLERQEGKHVRWMYYCPHCGRQPREARKRPWLAALAWNAFNLKKHSYRGLPLFDLESLSPEQAHQRMVAIRQDLELRRKLAGLDRRTARHLGNKTPGRQYLLRLDVYLKWAMLALSVIKNEMGASRDQENG